MIQVTPKRSVSIPYREAKGAGPSGIKISFAPSVSAAHAIWISASSLPYNVM